MMAHQLLLNAVLIIVMMFALDWYASRRTPHAARRERSHLRSLRRSAQALPHDRVGRETAISARRRASWALRWRQSARRAVGPRARDGRRWLVRYPPNTAALSWALLLW